MIERKRKVWQAPMVQVYGDMKSITLQFDGGDCCTNKDFGFSDGFTFSGAPIGCTS